MRGEGGGERRREEREGVEGRAEDKEEEGKPRRRQRVLNH